jgi:hypothetical protein
MYKGMEVGSPFFSQPTPRLEISMSGSEMVSENAFAAPRELFYEKVQGYAMNAQSSSIYPLKIHIIHKRSPSQHNRRARSG